MNSLADALPALSAVTINPSGRRHSPHRLAEHMEIDRHNVRIDIFENDPDHHGPTVLLLHGVGGLLGDGGLMRRASRRFAAGGCHACVVHYFNVTGTLFATHSNVRDHAGAWREAIIEVAKNYARLAGRPVGLFGYSLGGFLGVSAAEATDAIGAIAILSGGPCEERDGFAPSHLPPLLVLHGGGDKRVPLDRADALVQRGRRAGALVENVVYPNEGHSFGASAERDALDRAAGFFEARLEAGAPK